MLFRSLTRGRSGGGCPAAARTCMRMAMWVTVVATAVASGTERDIMSLNLPPNARKMFKSDDAGAQFRNMVINAEAAMSEGQPVVVYDADSGRRFVFWISAI